MKRFRFKKINAFTSGGSPGNPAACVFLDKASDITEEEMQRLARELKGFVSEVVYHSPECDESLLRYYSSECEVDFCGHGTVAAMYDHIASNPDLLKRDEISIIVKGERLTVYNRISREDSVYIAAPRADFLSGIPESKIIALALDTKTTAIEENRQVGFVRCGLATLIVPIKTLARCLALFPPQESLRLFCLDRGIDIILVYSEETSDPRRRYRTRVFAPRFGYLEDPATGSGNSAFGNYLLHHSMWDGEPLAIEQGPDRENPNIVRIASFGSGEKRGVMFGGSAQVKIEGEYIL